LRLAMPYGAGWRRDLQVFCRFCQNALKLPYFRPVPVAIAAYQGQA
jgi:hypothetical protein